MKKIIVIILCLMAFVLASQAQNGWLTPNNSYGTNMNGINIKRFFAIPTVCGAPAPPASNDSFLLKSAFAYDSCGHVLFIYDPSTKVFDTLRAASSGGFSPSDTTNKWVQNVFVSNDSLFKVKNGTVTYLGLFSTGGSMVYPSAGIALSTGSAWGTSIADNSANWNTVLNRVLYTDTANMLLPYLRKLDTVNLKPRLFAGWGLNLTGTYPTQTYKADSNLVASRPRVQKSVDSLGLVKWGVNGNSGTSATTNFIGTTDSVDLVFKIANTRSGYLNRVLANTSWGYGALNIISSGAGSQNTASGAYALMLNTAGGRNTATGYQSLYNTNSDYNTAYGFNSLFNNTTGVYNSAFGHLAGFYNTTQSYQIFINNYDAGNYGGDTSKSPIYIQQVVDVGGINTGLSRLRLNATTFFKNDIYANGLASSNNTTDSMMVLNTSNGKVGYRTIPTASNIYNTDGTQSSSVRSYSLGYPLSSTRQLNFGNYTTDRVQMQILGRKDIGTGKVTFTVLDSVTNRIITNSFDPSNSNQFNYTDNTLLRSNYFNQYIDSTVFRFNPNKIRYILGKDSLSIKGNLGQSSSTSDSVLVRDANGIVKMRAQSAISGSGATDTLLIKSLIHDSLTATAFVISNNWQGYKPLFFPSVDSVMGKGFIAGWGGHYDSTARTITYTVDTTHNSAGVATWADVTRRIDSVAATGGGGGGASQTPWLSNISAANHTLDSLKALHIFIPASGADTSQNLLIYSDSLSQVATWGSSGVNNLTVTDNVQGTLDLLTATFGTNNLRQDVAITASTTYYLSFDVKRGTSTDVSYGIYDLTHFADIIPTTSYYSSTTGSVTRVQFPFTTPAGCTSVALFPIRNIDNGGTIIAGNMQLSTSPTFSYVKTTASPIDTTITGGVSQIEVLKTDSITGNVGIGTTTPNSKLQVSGSLSLGYVAKAVDYNVSANDYSIEVTATGKTMTLPTAVGITGRIYVVTLTASGSSTVGTTSSQTINGSTTYSLGSQYKTVTVQSNGANWIVISNN